MQTLKDQFKAKIEAEKLADPAFQRGVLFTDEQKFRQVVDSMTRKAFEAMAGDPAAVASWRGLLRADVTEEGVRNYITGIGLRCKIMGNI